MSSVSIVIPAYNEEKYLPKTLESIKNQTHKADEILVINASSTDDTARAARKLGAKVLTYPKNTIGFSRQMGIISAQSDIVIQTDADAVLPPQWIERIYSYLNNKKYIGYFGGFRITDGPLWYRLYINFIQPFFNTVAYTIFRFPFATGQNMGFWRDEALRAGGIPKDFKIAEDMEIARRLQSIGRIKFTQSEYVIASGRRGYEKGILWRIFKVFFFYFFFRNANKVGFPAIR